MAQIELSGIRKEFKVYERPDGKANLFKGAFKREVKIVKALDDISFSIGEGELVGYIGPNGAGKSTSVKVMSGILTPDSGDCVIIGRVPWKERVEHVSQIGVVFGQRSQLWWDVPVKDSFDLLCDIYAISKERYKIRLNELVEALCVGSLLKTPTRQLSLGQRMRCELVAALLHEPKILFLDEPTIGLDAVSKLALRAFLKEENRRSGTTMLLTTHDMDDIEALCERVMVIGHGKLLFDGNLSNLKHRYAPLRRINAEISAEVGSFEIEGAEKVEINDKHCTVWFDPNKTPAQKIVALLAERLPLVDITIEEQDIDEMIATMYREMEL